MTDIQTKIKNHYKAMGFTNDPLTLALGIAEEAGEVAKAVNTFRNPKYKVMRHSASDTIEHEICDLLVYVYGLANALNIDVEAVMEQKMSEVPS